MAAPVCRLVTHEGQRARLWWLPSGGCGNGLDDTSWVPVLEISEQVVPQVLGALRDAAVAGYAAPSRPVSSRLRDRSGQPAGYRLWVGARGYGTAEAVLLAVMPSLAREAARRGDSAWR